MTRFTVERNYTRNLWSKYEVNIAVQAGIITEEEYTEITGDVYSKYIPSDSTLESYKAAKIAESKGLLEDYLSNNPILYNEQYYSITKEKQMLLLNKLSAYKEATALGIVSEFELTWNATGKTSEVWEYEDLLLLYLNIQKHVEGYTEKQRGYEVLINECETKQDVEAIVISYKD